jgi:flavin reductase (DIM6/NTAB) family NADH-FMN oxidoreductase RutF
MAKVKLTSDRYWYPRPALLVGAMVDGRPNFMAVGGGGVINANPPMIGIPIQNRHHTLKGIRQHLTFSVNTPSLDQVREVDYCGTVSGRDAHKAEVCGFRVFFGDLHTAPLIEQCPLNLECRVIHLLNLGSHTFVMGQVEGAFISEDCVTDGKPDAEKIRPMIFDMEALTYLSFGKVVARAYIVGRELKQGNPSGE